MCFVPNAKTGKWRELNRTETVYNTLNPDFASQIVMDFHFEETQPLKFSVFDRDSPSEDLARHDHLGDVEVCLGEIIGRYLSLANPSTSAAVVL